jgi:hypothetical protein
VTRARAGRVFEHSYLDRSLRRSGPRGQRPEPPPCEEAGLRRGLRRANSSRPVNTAAAGSHVTHRLGFGVWSWSRFRSSSCEGRAASAPGPRRSFSLSFSASLLVCFGELDYVAQTRICWYPETQCVPLRPT